MRLRRHRLRPSGRLARLTPSPRSGYSSHLLGGGLAFDPLMSTRLERKRAKGIPWPLLLAWCRRRGSNPHVLADTGF